MSLLNWKWKVFKMSKKSVKLILEIEIELNLWLRALPEHDMLSLFWAWSSMPLASSCGESTPSSCSSSIPFSFSCSWSSSSYSDFAIPVHFLYHPPPLHFFSFQQLSIASADLAPLSYTTSAFWLQQTPSSLTVVHSSSGGTCWLPQISSPHNIYFVCKPYE